MDLIYYPLELNETLKSATIYRNGTFNYIYVCYYCECSFINITDTLNHVESHFDIKVDIVTDNLEKVSEVVCKQELSDTKKRSETLCEIELPQSINQIITETNDKTPVVNIAEFESAIVEHKFEFRENFEEESKTNLNKISNKYLHSQCSICRHQCKTPSLLIIHLMKVHVNMTILTCPECSANCKTETEFEIHLQQHINNNQTTYDLLIDKLIAKCQVNVKVEIGNDKLRKNKKKCFTCDICSSIFQTKKCLFIHIKKEHVVAQPVKSFVYNCDKCERQFDKKFLFYAHQYGHLTVGDQVNVMDDDILRKNLKSFLDSNIDRDESTLNVTYSCKLCRDCSVTRLASIELHIFQDHIYHIKSTKNTVKRFPCEYCGVKFAIFHNLVAHKRTHAQEKPYTCSICNKSFAISRYLKYHHERVHLGIRPHLCSICGLSFKSNSKLNLHIKAHSDDRTKCTICSKEVKPHRLKIHIRNVHQNTHRPYKCDVCLQGFKTAKTLKTHSYRHSGEKNYECRFHCNERFISSAGRRAHERCKHETL